MSASKIKLTGRLLRHAEMRISTDGSAWLSVEIGQSQGRLAAIAIKRYGEGPAAQYLAGNAAKHLRAGSLVCIHAAGWGVNHAPHDTLMLFGVELIEQLERFYPLEAAERPQHA